MEHINSFIDSMNNQMSYMLVGAILMFFALFIFRKIMSIFFFVTVGLIIFAIIKVGYIEPKATGKASKEVLQNKIEGVKDSLDSFSKSLDEVKSIEDTVKDTVDEAKETKDNFDKAIEKLKPKDETEFDKLMKELEK